MKTSKIYTLTLIALACTVTASQSGAQKVYRCGSVYSQTPCEGAVTLDVNDSRTAAQKREADQLIEREAKAAKGMEARRIQEEKQVAARDAAARKETEQRKLAESRAAAAAQKPPEHHLKPAKKGKKEPEFFTAGVEKPAPEKKPIKP